MRSVNEARHAASTCPRNQRPICIGMAAQIGPCCPCCPLRPCPARGPRPMDLLLGRGPRKSESRPCLWPQLCGHKRPATSAAYVLGGIDTEKLPYTTEMRIKVIAHVPCSRGNDPPTPPKKNNRKVLPTPQRLERDSHLSAGFRSSSAGMPTSRGLLKHRADFERVCLPPGGC